MKEETFSDTNLEEETFSESSFETSSFHQSSLKESSFDKSSSQKNSFTAHSFTENSFDKHSFYKSTFDESSFEHSSFNQSSFEESSFDQSSLEESSLNSSFEQSSLEPNSFEGSSFEDSSFRGSSFQEDSLETAASLADRSFKRPALPTELAQLERAALTPDLSELDRPASHTELEQPKQTALKKAALSLELSPAHFSSKRESLPTLCGRKLEKASPQGGVVKDSLSLSQLDLDQLELHQPWWLKPDLSFLRKEASVPCSLAVSEKLCFSENTLKNVFSAKHSFSKIQLVKPTFSPMSKKHLFSQKRRHLWFWAISAETTIFIVFPGLHCFGPKKFFGQNR